MSETDHTAARTKPREWLHEDGAQAEQIATLQAQNQALLDFMESCQCGECGGSGRTDNHVTGEVECSACDGTGQDFSKAQSQIATLQADNALLRKIALNWNAEADKYLAQRDELQAENTLLREQVVTSRSSATQWKDNSDEQFRKWQALQAENARRCKDNDTLTRSVIELHEENARRRQALQTARAEALEAAAKQLESAVFPAPLAGGVHVIDWLRARAAAERQEGT